MAEKERAQAKALFGDLKAALSERILGQEDLIERVLIGIFAGGHVLLQGLPGLGKTALVSHLSTLLGLSSKRIQFTPDLLPGDITGNPILQEEGGKRFFEFQAGPVFCNVLLADEINRASPKTQSALLEAMQENSVTVLGEQHSLPQPFFVLATQNPIELEGTYPLPEAQLDRFMFRLEVSNPTAKTLEAIVSMPDERSIGAEVKPLLQLDDLQSALKAVHEVAVPQSVASFIARLVARSHEADGDFSLRCGASPRAALAFRAAGKARALSEGRDHVSYDDIRFLAASVLSHRVLLDYAARRRGLTSVDFVSRLLERVNPLDSEIPAQVTEVSPS